jgi:hypothetical protein
VSVCARNAQSLATADEPGRGNSARKRRPI